MLQPTWIKVLNGLNSLDEPGSLAAWLYRLARNTAIDFLNQQKKSPYFIPLNDEDVYTEDGSEEIKFENAALVHRGLEELRLVHREVLTLFFLEEFTIDEIAVILGLLPGTVKPCLHRARSAMKQFLKKRGISHVQQL